MYFISNSPTTPTTSPPLSPDSMEPQKVSRTLSNFLRGMIGSIPDPSPLPYPWDRPIEEVEEGILGGQGGGNMYLSASLSDRTPSSSSSSASSLGGASPQRRKFAGRFFMSQRSVTLKDTTTFKPLDRGVATLPIMRGTEEEEGEKENENVFEENGPRPRSEAIERRNRKISQDTAEKVKIKRKSMLFGRSSTSVSEDSSSSLDISGPEQREFDWRGRQHKAVRTTRRLSKSPQKRKDTMPSLSYASFEVRERREREVVEELQS